MDEGAGGFVRGAQSIELARSQEPSHMAALAGLGLAETALAFAHVVVGLELIPVAILHFGIVGVAARWLLKEQPPANDVTARALILLATAAAGPVGVLAGLLFTLAVPQSPTASPLLDDWYRRIALSSELDPVTELCDNVASGRTMNLASPAPQPFLSVMVSGAIAEQQMALGLIARRFHLDYLPALTRALRSPEPVIRVQAAAVVARIRDRLRAVVAARLAEFDVNARPDDAATALSELAKAAQSGLLDEADRLHIEALIAREASHGEDGLERVVGAAGLALGFKSFRVARRTGRIASRGAYRVRNIRRGRRKERGAE